MDGSTPHLTTSLEYDILALVRPLEPVPLLEVLKHANLFDTWGVYMLTEGKPERLDAGELPLEVVYIGKGIGEGIAGRSAKHLANMTGAVNSQGGFKIKTSRAIRAYRERVGHDPANLWFVAVPMEGVNGSVVSFAEEVLLEQYVRAHGRLPLCNTAGGRLWTPPKSRTEKDAVEQNAVPVTDAVKRKARARVAEDADLEALAVSVAARHGLTVGVIPMSGGPEPRIALGRQANGNLDGVAIRVMFKPKDREVMVYSKLQPAAAKSWALGDVRAESTAMKSRFSLGWPLNDGSFEELVLAAVAEARAQVKR